MDLTSEPVRLLENLLEELSVSKDCLLSGTGGGGFALSGSAGGFTLSGSAGGFALSGSAGGFVFSGSAGGFVWPDGVDGEGLTDGGVPLEGRIGVGFAAVRHLWEGVNEVDLGESGGADDVDDFQPVGDGGFAPTGEVGEMGFL